MLRSVLMVGVLGLALVGCGGSNSDNGVKPGPDKIKPKPILIDRYPEGIYLGSLANDAGDIVRGVNGYSQYVGVGFAVDAGTVGQITQEFEASIAEIGGEANQAGDWYSLTTKASKTDKLLHDIDLNYCVYEGATSCPVAQASTEIGDRLLKPLSSLHRAQLESNRFAPNFSPILTNKGFTVETDLVTPTSLLFVKTQALQLNGELMRSLVGSEWLAPTSHAKASHYSRYRFQQLPSGGLIINASMLDSQGEAQCRVTSERSFNAKQGLLMTFSVGMNLDEQLNCNTYLKNMGQSDEFVKALQTPQTVTIGFIAGESGIPTMALKQVAGDYSVAGAGLFMR